MSDRTVDRALTAACLLCASILFNGCAVAAPQSLSVAESTCPIPRGIIIPNDVLVPESFEAASAIVKGLWERDGLSASEAIDPATIEDCPLDKIARAIAPLLSDRWGLNDLNTPLARDMTFLGLRSAEEMVSMIVSGAADLLTGMPLNRVKLRRQVFFSQEDARAAGEGAPQCDFDAKQLVGFSTVNINGYGRHLGWRMCKDGRVVNYLWERGWFFPNESERAQFCADPYGDELRFCPVKK